MTDLVGNLSARALQANLTSELAGKEPTVIALPQSKMAGLVADLAAKAPTTSLANGLAGNKHCK